MATLTLTPPTLQHTSQQRLKPISQQHPIRILIVEDEGGLQEKYGIYIARLIEELLTLNRKIHYQIVTADCAAKAKKELQKASQGQAFDLMILDIEIPKDEDRNRRSIKDNGIEVGLCAMETGSVMNRAFISGKFGGISDADLMPLSPRQEEFKAKGSGLSDEQFVRGRLIYAINHRLWLTGGERLPEPVTPDDRWDEKCAQTLAKRDQELAPYAERSVVYSFGLCFSKCLRDVERSGDVVRSETLGRLGLDFERDTDDFLVQQLLEMDRSLKEGRHDWSKLQTSLHLDFQAEPKRVNIGEIIERLEKKFEPFRESKGAQLLTSKLESKVNDAVVISFNGEVEAVLSEMIFGALKDYRGSWNEAVLELSGEVDEAEGEWVKIKLKDHLRSLSSDDATAINAGIGVYSGKRFSRAWGLFVMQHVALQGGGRLTVQTSGGENTIVYGIPQALNA
jgi:CheY-like chemotaxis protein